MFNLRPLPILLLALTTVATSVDAQQRRGNRGGGNRGQQQRSGQILRDMREQISVLETSMRDLQTELNSLNGRPGMHERNLSRKADRDREFFELSDGVMDLQKITYKSRVDGMDIPAYVFQPLEKRGPKGHPALVWVHGGVHGDMTPNYWPYIKDAIDQGYIVICPEYRGSTGYGKDHYDAIDYGGYEVEDCLSAVDWLRDNLPHVDLDRLGMIGWSHGGFITLHGIFREQTTFKAAAAMVPVTNLVFRLGYKGPGYASSYTSQERIGGLPHEKRDIYIERSPVYHVDKLQIPLVVHITRNDRDVNFVECEAMVNALEHKKPNLVETKIYDDPEGGHSFNRLVEADDPTRAKLTPELRDSWNRIWAHFEWHLRPYSDPNSSSDGK